MSLCDPASHLSGPSELRYQRQGSPATQAAVPRRHHAYGVRSRRVPRAASRAGGQTTRQPDALPRRICAELQAAHGSGPDPEQHHAGTAFHGLSGRLRPRRTGGRAGHPCAGAAHLGAAPCDGPLKRVSLTDITVCPHCGGTLRGGTLRVIAAVADPALVGRIVAHVRERGPPTPRRAPARPHQPDLLGASWIGTARPCAASLLCKHAPLRLVSRNIASRADIRHPPTPLPRRANPGAESVLSAFSVQAGCLSSPLVERVYQATPIFCPVRVTEAGVENPVTRGCRTDTDEATGIEPGRVASNAASDDHQVAGRQRSARGQASLTSE